jgi:hypothetical protein
MLDAAAQHVRNSAAEAASITASLQGQLEAAKRELAAALERDSLSAQTVSREQANLSALRVAIKGVVERKVQLWLTMELFVECAEC